MFNTRARVFLLSLLVTVLCILTATISQAAPKGDLIIYHAGSLSIPLSRMISQFNQQYPEVHVITKAGGSTKMARLISEKGETADIMASADYTVIDNNLIPRFATWNIRFATNQLVLCYTDNSKYASTVSSLNWHEVLRDPKVSWGHSDPNLDPCGYRSLMVMQLAERYYNIQGLYQQLLANRPSENVKTKAIELVELLKSSELDYGWEYLSVAIQHDLRYIEFNDQINLGNYQYDPIYATAHVKVTGQKPGTLVDRTGKSITYGVTLMKEAPHREAAEAFLEFMLSADKGLRILDQMGQPPFTPARVADEETRKHLPLRLAALVEVRS